MTDSIFIQGARLINPASGQDATTDVRISGGAISHLGTKLQPTDGDSVIDGRGLWICPGLIDMHTHLRDLGQKDKEDIASGTAAAAAGGFTTVVAMANTAPTLDNGTVFKEYLQRIQEKARIEVLPCAAVTVGLNGKDLTNMVELAELGAVAFSDDGMTIGNLLVLRRALQYAQSAGRVIISHAEDRDLSHGGVIQECRLSTQLGLSGIPQSSESAAVAREIEVVRQSGSPYHFTHLSCADSINLVKRAKEDGLRITCDATPHHLTLCVDDIPGYDSNYKMKPPLRLKEDKQAIINGLKDGTIDAIATDHAPHTRLDKSTAMDEAAVGITGLETAFSLCLENLVTPGFLTPLQLVGTLTCRPAAILGLPSPNLEVGACDIAIFDSQLKWTYDAAKGFSKGQNSPFSGKVMTGKTVLTICGGKVVFRDEQHLAARFLRQEPTRSAT